MKMRGHLATEHLLRAGRLSDRERSGQIAPTTAVRREIVVRKPYVC